VYYGKILPVLCLRTCGRWFVDGGRFATSHLNDLYAASSTAQPPQKLYNDARHIIATIKRMLQEAWMLCSTTPPQQSVTAAQAPLKSLF
jgi:DNA-directed RNA polymerase beta' subunit